MGGTGSGRVWAVTLVAAVLAACIVVAVVAERPVGAQAAGTGYQKKNAPLDTPWTAEVGPKNALPEYPRPQMRRAQWQNLMNARRPVYERLATLQVSTDGLRPGQVADRIVEALGATDPTEDA